MASSNVFKLAVMTVRHLLRRGGMSLCERFQLLLIGVDTTAAVVGVFRAIELGAESENFLAMLGAEAAALEAVTALGGRYGIDRPALAALSGAQVLGGLA